jgi:tricorn protease-like protein
MGIWQRDLESYRTREMAHGRTFGYGCVNCHTFLNQNPNRMILSTRSRKYNNAALVTDQDNAIKLGVKFGYPVWHPSGTFITYVDFDVFEFLHSSRKEFLDVFDMRSCIAQYNLTSGTVNKMPDLIGPRVLETYPAWAPDGKTLYFCSAPMLWDSLNIVPPENYNQVRYNLCSIAYDPLRKRWGKADTILSAQKTGMSILQPRVSPDGRFILFCMCDYSVFPTYQKSSDLYILDLSTHNVKQLSCNSSESESWHSWSSNSRWIAFSSKRDDGEFTRTYISYIDSQGNARKPFLIPQKNPAFYRNFLRVMNVPEFITGPVKISKNKIGATAMQK